MPNGLNAFLSEEASTKELKLALKGDPLGGGISAFVSQR